MAVVERDVAEVSATFLIHEHIDRMKKAIKAGKEFRALMTSEQREVIDSCTTPEINDLNLAFAISKMSLESITQWESNIDIIDGYLSGDAQGLLELDDIRLVELFIAFLTGLKQKSRRHLLNFLSASADGDWVDALFVGHGADSEVRSIDQCSDDTRGEFGIGKK